MYASILLALAATAAAAPVSTSSDAPKGWAKGYLENYDVYHTRYLALNCYEQHNTTFFQECCRPMLATENLQHDRAAHCTPNATQSSSAAEYESTATSTISADSEAESEYSVGPSSSTWSAAAETSAVAEAAQAAAEPTTTSTWVAPTTTSTWEAPAETTKASSGNSPSGNVHSGGFATFFYQNGNAGACGQYHSDSDAVVAIDGNGWWQDFSQASDLCGKWVNIKNTNNGKTVTAKVADVCPTCVSDNSLDLSIGAFDAIASQSDGMVPIEWSFA